MALTWGEFLNLAAHVQNLYNAIYDFDIKRNDFIDFNHRVFETAQNYSYFLRDARDMEIIKYIRIS